MLPADRRRGHIGQRRVVECCLRRVVKGGQIAMNRELGTTWPRSHIPACPPRQTANVVASTGNNDTTGGNSINSVPSPQNSVKRVGNLHSTPRFVIAQTSPDQSQFCKIACGQDRPPDRLRSRGAVASQSRSRRYRAAPTSGIFMRPVCIWASWMTTTCGATTSTSRHALLQQEWSI